MTAREDALLDHYAPLEGHLAVARHLLSDAYALLDTIHQDPAVTVLRAEIAVFLGIDKDSGAGASGSGEAPEASAPAEQS